MRQRAFVILFLFLVPLTTSAKTYVISDEAVGMHFERNDKLQLPDGSVFRIKREIEAGEDRRVYKVARVSDDEEFVFKHARTREIAKGRDGMQKEIRTVQRLADLKVLHPAVRAAGTDWVLRDWTRGDLATVWFRKWKKKGFPGDDLQWLKFASLVARTANQGLVIGAMDLDDLILSDEEATKGEWVVIDSGRVREMTVAEAWKFYVDDLQYSWGDKINEPSVCPVLAALLGEAERFSALNTL